MVEIGIPFSDPIADGPTIQASNQKALDNGINLAQIFEQLKGIREEIDIPILLMGYINPVIQYGIERFCKDAKAIGVDGMILPDLPLREYETEYKSLFEAHGLSNIFLISPQTTDDRIHQIDSVSNAFVYVVSTDSTTGKSNGFGEKQVAYFNRIEQMKLENPTLIGFGIADATTFQQATAHANGAIIGSAFIKAISQNKPLSTSIPEFVAKIRDDQRVKN
ncbi:UNVERIFIED_CONTAM: hypothetical protein GTU68_016606 [Idotea baltica]|nr:hypothetical protein [Idotea baltica]